MERISYPKEIQLFFNDIVEKIKQVLDPDYILIAGSFGKESWLYDEDKLVSDFEFVFVCKKRWSLKDKKLLQIKLENEYPHEISLKGYLLDKIQNKVISNYSSKNPGYISLDFFDTFDDPQLLYGKNNNVLTIECKSNEIPVWEAWRLYVNRMGDLLKIEYSNNNDEYITAYYWLKIFESTAGAYCIINGVYHKNILKRLETFNEELIKKDKELDDVCKNSFDIINQALLARSKHDLSLFKNNLSIKERKEIVNSWMQYFEKKLSTIEQFSFKDKQEFHSNYLNHKKLQNKYLGFNYHFNKIISNSIRLINYPLLINFNFKFYNLNVSWRHIILLCVASIYKDSNLHSEGFLESRKIAQKIVRVNKANSLTDKDFVKFILKYWKILR